jgi:membrane fusion protein YbhG
VKPPRHIAIGSLACLCVAAASCEKAPPADRARVSGQVEATDVHISAPVGGRILELGVSEGGRVEAGALIARLDTADAELALTRARADRSLADAQLRLLRAGSRAEDIHQGEAQVDTARAEASAANAELGSAQGDLDRFEQLLASNSGSRKQRDDARSRRDVARDRLAAANNRVASATASLARLRAGARPEEIAAAEARVQSADAQIAIWDKAIADATVTAPIAGVVSDVIADRGELIAPRSPIAVITDLDHAWANVYVDEPIVPRLRIGQPATIHTDAGGEGITGTVTYISSTAEFTPRNVQTAEDRSQLVYRVKVSVDNARGVLKSGMPVEADLPFQP